MTVKKLKLTWDKAGARWRKIYKGKVWYGKRGVKKSDDEAYRQAVEDFEQWRGDISKQAEKDKPNAEQYENQIGIREEMVRICLLEGEMEQETHDRLVKEIAWLRKNLAKTNPPKITFGTTVVPDPLAEMTIPEKMKWFDRIDALRQHNKWTGATEKEKSLSALIDKHLQARLLDAQTGQIRPQRYENIKYWLTIFKIWIGDLLSIEQFNSTHLSAFREYLLGKIKAEDYSTSYARSILNEAKIFAHWLYNQEFIDRPLRNLKNLTIEIEDTKEKTLPIKDVKHILSNAGEELKLHILLMLNTAMTQKDIGDLKQEEVNWEDGRINRKRTKTARKKNVPKVNYLLWKETFELLQRFRSKDPIRVLLNCRGNPLRDMDFKSEGDTRLKKNDTIAKAFTKLCHKIKVEASPKMFRATSANLLFNSRFRLYHQLFLDHSAKTVAETNYVENDDTTLDDAIRFLGEQYGIK